MKIKMDWAAGWNAGTVVGIVVTGIAGYLCGMSAARELDNLLAEKEDVSIKEKATIIAVESIPVLAAAAVTGFCFHKVKTGYTTTILKQAAEIAALGFTAQQAKEYKEAVIDTVGEEKEKEIQKRAIEKDRECKKDQYFGIEDGQHLFRYSIPGGPSYAFRATTGEVLNALIEIGRDIFEDSEFVTRSHGIGVSTVTELLTYCGHSYMTNDNTDDAGWTRGYLEETYGAQFFDYKLQPKKDMLGREFIDIILYPPIHNVEYWAEKDVECSFGGSDGNWIEAREAAGVGV